MDDSERPLISSQISPSGSVSFAVAEQGLRCQWNPEEADFAQVPALAEYLLAE